jgi:hypothetical protein
MFELFIFGTIWFWILISLIGVIIIYATEESDPGHWHWAVLLVGTALLYFGGAKQEVLSVISYMKDNPTTVLLRCLAYIGIGVTWSIAKWYFYVLDLRDKYMTRSPEYRRDLYKSSTDMQCNKTRIINWMMYWPISAIWTLINQPFRRLFLYLYGRFEKVFVSITDHIGKDFLN